MLACIFAPRPVKQPIRFGDGVHSYTKPDSSLFILFLPPMFNDKGQIKYIVTYYSSFRFLPPATKLEQGYIFIGVCDSVHGGGGVLSQHALLVVSQHALQQVSRVGGLLLGEVCSWGSAPGRASWRPPGTPLLECILVGLNFPVIQISNYT